MHNYESVNFAQDNNSQFSREPKRPSLLKKLIIKMFKKIGKLSLWTIIFIIAVFFITSYKPIFSKDSVANNFGNINIFQQVKRLITSSDKLIDGEKHDRINILLLGMGGQNHQGGNLTDTIILGSIKPSTKQAALVSIPRDLVVDYPPYGWRKINNINAFSQQDGKNGGEELKKFLSKTFNIPIHYYTKIDFEGFEKIIDSFGGVDVLVENTLSDYSYPIRGNENVLPIENRYEHLHIEKGWQHMDGSLALKYARSRHAMGIEGSDYARARRQQNLIFEFKKKALSLNSILKPHRINKALNVIQDNFDTDMEIWEMIKLSKIVKDFKKEDVNNEVLDDGPHGYLYADNVNGAFVLQPRAGNFLAIESMIKNIFNTNDTVNVPDNSFPILPKIADSKEKKDEKIKIEIQNGTKTNGLASRTSSKLEDLDFNVIKIGNAQRQDYEKTVIYDLTLGRNSKHLKVLKETMDANVSVNLPKWLEENIENGLQLEQFDLQNQGKAPTNTKADFLIILGKTASEEETENDAMAKN